MSVRRSAWVALLVAEVLVLSAIFQSGALHGDRRWWAELLGHSGEAIRLGGAAAAATLLIGAARRRGEVWRWSGPHNPPHRRWPLLLGHLIAFAGFCRLTAMVLGREVRSSSHPAGWIASWVALGLVTLASWVAVMLPPRLWAPLAKRGRGVLLTGIAAGAAVRLAGQASKGLWQPLCRPTFRVIRALLGLIYPRVVCQPEDLIVGTPTFWIVIKPECSGYEGIGLIWAFLGLYFWLFRRDLRFPRALLLLPFGTALIWVLNAVRVAGLVAVGTEVSPEVALKGFHSQAGWLAFVVVALGLVAASHHRSLITRDRPPPRPTGGGGLTAAYLAPLFVGTATATLTGAFSSGFDRLYPLRVLAVAGALWAASRPRATGLRRTWSWPAVGIGAVAFALWLALEPWPRPAAASALRAGLAGLSRVGAGLWLAFRTLGAVLTVPLAEELAFRGYLNRRLIRADISDVPPGQFRLVPFLVSSALFGALHEGRWLAGMLAGMLYALALYRRGELTDAVVAHATTNALIAASVLLAGTWSLWE
ncbi:MAG TPA: exosortase E/protease, VPEID-CTERM system [Isosphaeraceae bacterium]|nr:exosortase E/protease, VPEID-CTERM system [Isosphaeraceae bacterium]